MSQPVRGLPPKETPEQTRRACPTTTRPPTYFHMAQCLARCVVIRISEMMLRYTLGTGRGKSSLNLVIVSDTVGTSLPRYVLYFW